jgi:hypothetical protein
MDLDLKFTRSGIRISRPLPTIYTFSKQTFMVYIHEDLMAWEILIHEPSHDALTPVLGILVT